MEKHLIEFTNSFKILYTYKRINKIDSNCKHSFFFIIIEILLKTDFSRY